MLRNTGLRDKCLIFGYTLETENYEVATGINYEYFYIKSEANGTNSKPTLLFLHGFPSSFHVWRHQIEYFSQRGYGCLAMNMMGYGRTYSPLNATEYKAKSMVIHLITLLDYLQIDKVFVIVHDWGTRPASRFVLYHPERTLGLVLISIPYGPPSVFNFDQVLDYSKEVCGFEVLGYWEFFNSADAAEIIQNNLDSFIDIIYASNMTLSRTDFFPLGKLREWVTNRKRTVRDSYLTENDYEILRQYLAEGMQPKLNWYKAAIENIDWNDEKNMDPTIQRPVLFIKEESFDVCPIFSSTEQSEFIPNYEMIELNAGHWVMEETPDEVNRAIDKWIRKIK
ncbi:unnamed protein product [Rotaria sordida]|uniref:AB hydrolase-1 domain-containing protein n=2 Tax=Rotaria sordida TaxID=392033 RepID=A0A819HPF0_9BILA|nr:unnamed protein product [Rotaria sordida]CAF3903325.1 unnamed protein product [Rotaria sordida]